MKIATAQWGGQVTLEARGGHALWACGKTPVQGFFGRTGIFVWGPLLAYEAGCLGSVFTLTRKESLVFFDLLFYVEIRNIGYRGKPELMLA